MFGTQFPIILAPMAGGTSTPALAAAVSNAGGLGSLGAAYLSPAQIGDEIARIRARTDRPFAVNVFAAGYHTGPIPDPAPMLALLGEIHAAWGLPAPVLPAPQPSPFPDQLEVVLDAKVPAFSFTFGIPDADALERLRRAGIAVMGTATTVDEGRMLADAGVDAIVAQGAEAGAHRGSFLRPFEESLVPTLDLVRGIVAATDVPVIASGGIMDGAGIAAALRARALAVQLGTAFLASPESGASEAYRRAILSATEDRTTLIRAYSGRPARGISNAFHRQLAGRETIILPFPVQNTLTRPMRAEAARRGDAEHLSLWAGTGVARARSLPAAELVRVLLREMDEAENEG